MLIPFQWTLTAKIRPWKFDDGMVYGVLEFSFWLVLSHWWSHTIIWRWDIPPSKSPCVNLAHVTRKKLKKERKKKTTISKYLNPDSRREYAHIFKKIQRLWVHFNSNWIHPHSLSLMLKLTHHFKNMIKIPKCYHFLISNKLKITIKWFYIWLEGRTLQEGRPNYI